MANKIQRQQLLFRKLRFYNQNKPTIDRLANSDDDWRTPKIREFIEQARAEIGYSQTTAPCDIYSALISLTPAGAEKRRIRWTKS